MPEGDPLENASGKRKIGSLKAANRDGAVAGLRQVLYYRPLSKGPNLLAKECGEAKENDCRYAQDYEPVALLALWQLACRGRGARRRCGAGGAGDGIGVGL